MTKKTTLQNTAADVTTSAVASAPADPAQKVLDTFLKTTRKQVLKDQKVARERDKAIIANLPAALDELEPEALRQLFVVLEASATNPQRNLIATHPMRPEGIDDRVEEAVAKRAEEAEKAKARREEERKEKERQKFEELKRKFEPDAATNIVADEVASEA